MGRVSCRLIVILTSLLSTSVQAGAGGYFAPIQTSHTSDKKSIYLAGEKALQGGQLTAAEKDFRQVLAIDPHDPGANSNLGVIYMRRKQWNTALKYLNEAEKAAPQVAGVRLNIGLAYYRQGKFAAAIVPF